MRRRDFIALRGGRVAAIRADAASGDAGGRVSAQRISGNVSGGTGRVPPGTP
jgi:hypothetical protein